MKKRKILVLLLCLFCLTGCTKMLKDEENQVVRNEETGQTITENVICKPTNETTLKIYEEYEVDIESLPSCKEFTPLSNYEGLWTSIFVKPLAWLILKIGSLVNSNGLAIILSCLLIRIALIPVTKKTAMQSENMKKAQPEMEKLERKNANKTSQEDQTRKAQEMMLIYQKHNINPVSGCLLALIQLPLLFAFLEAIQRTPAIFENNFLVFQMGTTVPKGIASGNYWYIILIVLILGATYFSFKNTNSSNGNAQQEQQMKMMSSFMVVFIGIASFSLQTSIALYWIVSNGFTIVQNMIMKKGN